MSKRQADENGLGDRPAKSRKELEEEDENIDSSEHDSEFEGLQDSEEDSEGDDFGGEELEDEDEEQQEDVQIEFCAFNPEKEDFHGITQLLKRLWLQEPVNTSKIADFIIEKQSQFATLLRQVDDDAPEVEEKKEKPKLGEEGDEELPEDDFDQVYSLLTVIPFNNHFRKETPELIGDLEKWLLAKLPKDSKIRDKVNNTAAYMISERFINIPIRASIPCYEGLLKDIQERPEEYKFDNIIMQTKIAKDKKTLKEIVYTNAEEELFFEKADDSFEYSVADQCDSDYFDWKDEEKLYEPFRKIILISKDKWINVIKSLPKECQ